MNNFILFFNQIQKDDLSLVGGKALSLGAMVQSNLCVPPGFCITTEAYRDFIAHNRLESYILEKLEKMDYNNTNVLRSTAEAIQNKVLQSVMPDNVKEEIISAYHRSLGENKWKFAVRSSAIAEDAADASFAGQHDTFLGITGEQSLLVAIQKCWASLWNARVIQYRARSGYEHAKAALAVVIQQMIPSQISGVLFTANPLNDNLQEMVINATWGLGEALVGGMVEADQIVVSTRHGQIKPGHYHVGHKDKMVCMEDSPSGTVILDIPAQAEKKCLSESQIVDLAKLGQMVQNQKGCPQDIEWGIWQDKIYLFQSRPITTLASSSEPIQGDKPKYWTADNAQEALPGVTSFYTRNVIKILMVQSIQFFSERCDIEMKDTDFVGFFDGYTYLNVNALTHVIHQIFPAADEESLVKQILGKGEEGGLRLRYSKDLKLRKLLKLFWIGITDLLYLPDRSRKALRRVSRDMIEIKRKNLNVLPMKELRAIYDRIREYAFEELVLHMHGTMAYTVFYGGLVELMRPFSKVLGISPSIFVSNLGTLEDARMKEALLQVAQIAREHREAERLILQEDASQIVSKLKNVHGGQEVLDAFNAFLQDFGHLGNNMVDFSSSRWIEENSSLWKMLKIQLSGPLENMEEKRKIVRRSQREAMNKIHDYLCRGLRCLFPIQWIQFLFFRKMAVYHAPYRENIKFHLMKWFVIVRKILLIWGKYLQEKGYLKTAEQIFTLEEAEILDALDGRCQPLAVYNMVERRESQAEIWKRMIPARGIYTANGKVIRKVYETGKKSARQLKGVAASGGCVKGKARIILDLAEADQFQKGEILVTRFTDPSWTILFGLASAIVMDVGSLLSHGAVVARELGIPAVVGIQSGTEIIKNGQEITVDGTSGIVSLG